LVTFGTSSSAGVPASFVNETLVVPLNNKEAVEKAFAGFKDQIACLIIEPVPANNGLLLQDKAYLQYLRDICLENNTLLIFDEVISGFRLGFTGAAGYYNIRPDIVTYGKIIGGGLPVGAYASSDAIMSKISPDGDVYQAGTLSGNPVAMSAGIAQLTECLKTGFYEDLERKTKFLTEKIPNLRTFSIGSIFWVAFTEKEQILSADDIDPKSMEKFRILHRELLEKGIYLGPSGYEVGFVSAAHTEKDLEITAAAFAEAMEVVYSS
jgi:glutamate-1-semialdehyde 2,1-aminomutase